MLALPVPTQLLNPTIAEGKWLNDPTAHEVVLNQSARGTLKIGDEVSLAIEEKVSTWKVIGFVEDVGSHSTAYVPLQTFSAITNTSGKAELLRISYLDRSKENAMRKNLEIEKLLEKENIAVSSIIPVWLLRNAIAAHMKVLVNSLLAMALLMALVGTIGLVSTMSMSVLERTREIGVMRAIGATPAKIRNLIIWEGLLIGTISIFLAFALSVVLSTYMGRVIGDMAFRTPLSLTISTFALITWIVAIFVVAYVAVLLPARRANRISTREALAYE
jgi:putative ABC transport system permease protein